LGEALAGASERAGIAAVSAETFTSASTAGEAGRVFRTGPLRHYREPSESFVAAEFSSLASFHR